MEGYSLDTQNYLCPTSQVLGITNYSHWGDAGDMRSCVWQSNSVREHMLEIGINRINKFMHVGVTNRLSDSVAASGVSWPRKGARKQVGGVGCYQMLGGVLSDAEKGNG